MEKKSISYVPSGSRKRFLTFQVLFGNDSFRVVQSASMYLQLTATRTSAWRNSQAKTLRTKQPNGGFSGNIISQMGYCSRECGWEIRLTQWDPLHKGTCNCLSCGNPSANVPEPNPPSSNSKKHRFAWRRAAWNNSFSPALCCFTHCPYWKCHLRILQERAQGIKERMLCPGDSRAAAPRLCSSLVESSRAPASVHPSDHGARDGAEGAKANRYWG